MQQDAFDNTPHGWDWGVKTQVGGEDEERYEYAGFLIRLVASVIDSFILGAITIALIALPVIYLISADFDYTALTCLSNAVVVALSWLYYAGFESSRYMGTPGKLMCGIKVTDTGGNGISLGKATMRYVLKMFLGLFFLIGYLFILISDKKQGLYDVLAGTMVIKNR